MSIARVIHPMHQYACPPWYVLDKDSRKQSSRLVKPKLRTARASTLLSDRLKMGKAYADWYCSLPDNEKQNKLLRCGCVCVRLFV